MSRIRTLLVLAAASVATVALAAPASAHTEAGTHTDANGSTTVTLDVGHGCDGKPTTGLRVQLPTGSSNVDAENPDGWTSTTTPTELQWSGPALSADAHHEFSFSLVLTQAPGTVVTFPTIQQCTDGASLAWIDTATPGDPEPPHPAPSIVVGGAGNAVLTASPTTTSGPTTTVRMATNSEAVTKDGSATNGTGRIVFFAVMAVIVIGAVGVFLSARRKKQQS